MHLAINNTKDIVVTLWADPSVTVQNADGASVTFSSEVGYSPVLPDKDSSTAAESAPATASTA